MQMVYPLITLIISILLSLPANLLANEGPYGSWLCDTLFRNTELSGASRQNPVTDFNHQQKVRVRAHSSDFWEALTSVKRGAEESCKRLSEDLQNKRDIMEADYCISVGGSVTGPDSEWCYDSPDGTSMNIRLLGCMPSLNSDITAEAGCKIPSPNCSFSIEPIKENDYIPNQWSCVIRFSVFTVQHINCGAAYEITTHNSDSCSGQTSSSAEYLGF